MRFAALIALAFVLGFALVAELRRPAYAPAARRMFAEIANGQLSITPARAGMIEWYQIEKSGLHHYQMVTR